MSRERVSVASQFGDHERHALCYQTSDERDIAREAIKLRNQDWAFGGASGAEGCGELRPTVERVGSLAGLGLDESGDDGDLLYFGEAGDGRALRLDSEIRALELGPLHHRQVGRQAAMVADYWAVSVSKSAVHCTNPKPPQPEDYFDFIYQVQNPTSPTKKIEIPAF